MNYDSVPLRDFKELNDWETVIFVYQSALKQVETKIDILNGEFQHGSLTVGYQKKVPAGRIKPAFFVSNFWFLSIVFYCNVL